MLNYFFDPVLQATTLGTCLMCLASSLIGVVVLIQKRSLVGESLSHSAYPGVILGALLGATLFQDSSLLIIPGAMLSAYLGLQLIQWLTRRGGISQDAALCFTLSFLFSIGVFWASRIQFTASALYKHLQVYLYGQAATMMPGHVLLYGILAVCTILFLICFYRPIQLLLFDASYAKSLGAKHRFLQQSLSFLLILALVLGIRCVGIILISGMLVAPAIAARALSSSLSKVFFLAACFGVGSGLLGNVLGNELSLLLDQWYPGKNLYLPTGPMIMIVGFLLSFCVLLFAPPKGLFFRSFRAFLFRIKCEKENLLKEIYKKGPSSFAWRSRFSLWRLKQEGYLRMENKKHHLTEDGEKKVLQIIRGHRLWELYLTHYMAVGAEKVHKSAEDIEHVITPQMERSLTNLLANPKKDPHSQPIPDRYPL